MNPKNEIDKISQIFINLGAPKQNAEVMAKQLIKRAEQIAEEKNTSKIKELQKLLEISVLGAQGRLHPSDEADFDEKKPQMPKKSRFCEKKFDHYAEKPEQRSIELIKTILPNKRKNT